MGEKRTMAIVTILAEPRKTKGDPPKDYWVATDSDDVEWLVWEKRLADGIREHKGDILEYDVYVKTTGERVSRTINGVPSIPELAPEKKSGGGGWRGGGRDYVPRSAASFAFEQRTRYPSFALSYAHDEAVAGKVPPEQVLDRANQYLAWMEAKLAEIVRTAPVLDAAPVSAPTPAAKTSAAQAPAAASTSTAGSGSPPASEPSAKLREALEIFGGESRFLSAAARILGKSLTAKSLSTLTAEEIGRVVASKAA